MGPPCAYARVRSVGTVTGSYLNRPDGVRMCSQHVSSGSPDPSHRAVLAAIHGNATRDTPVHECSDRVRSPPGRLSALSSSVWAVVQVNEHLGWADLYGVSKYLPDILDKYNVRVLFYSGQFDFICNHLGESDPRRPLLVRHYLSWPGTDQLLAKVPWSGQEAFRSAQFYAWVKPHE
jgi:hypothetical protein